MPASTKAPNRALQATRFAPTSCGPLPQFVVSLHAGRLASDRARLKRGACANWERGCVVVLIVCVTWLLLRFHR
jgi:hypothetical protein